MSSLTVFQSRYSTKLFDSTKKVSKEDIDILIETARLAPSALGIPVVRLMHIADIQTRAELQKHSLNQSQIIDASNMLVFVVKNRFDQKDIGDYIALMAHTRGVTVESLGEHQKFVEKILSSFSEKELVDWFQKQAYIALGFVLSQCAILGIDSCPIGLIDANKYDTTLCLDTKGLHATVVLMVGHRSEQDVCQSLPKVRIGAEQFLISAS